MKRKLANSTPSASRPPPKKRERGEMGVVAPMMPPYPVEGEEQKPASESDISLLQYQNRQLSNTLQERKEEIVLLQSKIRGFRAQQALYDNTLGFVARNWDSLNENLQNLLARYECNGVATEEQIKEAEKNPSEEKRSFLQLLLRDKEIDHKGEEGEVNDEEEEELDEKELAAKELLLKQKIDGSLEQRANVLTGIFINLLNAMQQQKRRSDELADALKQRADEMGVHQSLAAENSELKKRLASSERLLDDLQYRNDKLKKQNSQCKDGWIQAEKRLREASVELEDAKMDVSNLRNRCRRLHDQLQDAQKQAKMAPLQAQPIANSGEKLEPAGPAVVDPRVKEELAEAEARSEDRMNEIKNLRQERAELLKEINNLKFQLLNPPDTVVLKSPQYQLLHQQSRLVLMDLDALRNQNTLLQHSLSVLEDQRKEEKEDLLKSEAARRKALEEEVREKMGLITRLRGEREEMQYRIDQKKAAPPASKVVSEFKVILSSTQAQNKKLEKETKRLKAELAKLQEAQLAASKKRESGGPEAPPPAPDAGIDWQEKVKGLQRTLEEFQRREKKMEEAQREMKVMLDVYQSESKERRDLTEIRRSERKLMEELKRLQARLARYERDPRQPPSQPRPEGEKHRGHEKPPQPPERRVEPPQMDKSTAELRKALENEKKEAEMLLAEMSAISKSFEELQEQNARLLQQLSEKDDSSTKLLSERIKSEQVQHLLREETKALQQQLKAAAEKFDQQKEALQREEEKIRLLEQQLEKSNEQFKQMNNLIELHKRTAREAAEQTADLRNKVEHAAGVIAELKKANEELTASLHKEEEKASRLAEERNSLKRRLDKYTSKGSADSMLEEELISVKKMLICPVCNDRKKDTVITRCYHVFCNQCIRKNLSLRHRKCPGCAKPFGEKDVQSIYLGYDHDELEGKD